MSTFVSHAREDRDTALAIYECLRSRGLSAWIDVRNLLPGQIWEVEIRKAIRNSNIFLACLSARSVRKRGYVQSELKRAMEVLETMPEGQVFVIPVRLDDCEVPTALERLHWVDYFMPEGPAKLFEAVTAYEGGTPEAVDVRLQFAKISIDYRNPYWGEKPICEHRSPFGQEGKRYFTLTKFVEGADPSFDVTVLNMSTEPIVLTAIGIDVLKAAERYYCYGMPTAAKVPMQDWYVLDIPELRNELFPERDFDSEPPPREVNRIISMNLPDPVYMESKAPYRFGLLLDGYYHRMPNHVVRCLWLNSNFGEHRSEEIEIFTL